MIPDCPKCDANRTLQPYGAIVEGLQWHCCTCCATPVLIRVSDGTILRLGKP